MNIIRYFQDVSREARKVAFPTKNETIKTLITVLIFTAIAMLFFAVVDFAIIKFVNGVLL